MSVNQAPPKQAGCFGKAVKGMLIVVGILFALLIIVAIMSPSTSTREPRATSTPAKTIAEIKAEAVEIEYKDLYRNIETHVGKVLHATGEIVQASNNQVFRVNITKDEYGFYSDTIWLEYAGDDRLLEDDIIEFWATVEGLHKYETIMGGEVELPRLTINAVELIGE